MGTYLSTPVTEKCQEEGDTGTLSWGVVDMQGWRKGMEDAHVAVNDANIGDAARGHVFAVFDGHGGPEVARFCSLYLVSVLSLQHNEPSKKGEEEKTDAAETSMGSALRSTFHALDRLIDDPTRRDELIRLRAIKPDPGELRCVTEIPPPRSLQPEETSSVIVEEVLDSDPETDPAKATEENQTKDCETSDQSSDEPKPSDSSTSKEGETNDDCTNEKASEVKAVIDAIEDNKKDELAVEVQGLKEEAVVDDPAPVMISESKESDESNEDGDDDSEEAVGHEEAAEQDQNLSDEEEEEEENEEEAKARQLQEKTTAIKVGVILQRLLNLSAGNPSSGQIVVPLGTSDATGANLAGSAVHPNRRGPGGPSASQPSVLRNGQMICNLPDHPIHAGATAIVAVLVDQTLTVANAGDSRAVLCRSGGLVYPLSFDHKPMQERELGRIRNAGGFVNSFGRINGNLNLSRSIGDLKYKQVPHLPPAEQMITAEPDIMEVTLQPGDEFIILGCDGIWDCLTNEKAVEFVRSRIDKKTPTEIGAEMLDEIISDDPRATQGIGGDNMTVMIIDLLPHTRSYRRAADATPI